MTTAHPAVAETGTRSLFHRHACPYESLPFRMRGAGGTAPPHTHQDKAPRENGISFSRHRPPPIKSGEGDDAGEKASSAMALS